MAVKENIYEYLKMIEKKANEDIKRNYKGYEDFKVKTVKHYDKDVELVNRKNKKNEKFDLTIVEVQNQKEPEETRVLYYLNGEEVNYLDLLMEYETEEAIRDLINVSKENKEKPKKEQKKELEMQDLEELEKEKDSKKKENNKKKNEEQKRKPKYIIQEINLDEAYSDNIETVHRAFRLPTNVKKLAFAYPNKEDKYELGNGATIYMLDDNDNIVGNAKEYFKVDDATGKNPIYDDNTEIEVDKTGERHSGKTMRRFESTKIPGQHLSLKQKEVGQYPEVYADREKATQNAYIGNQVNTRNTSLQTSLEIQKINSTYKGIYHPDSIDKEVDTHEEHGDDIDKLSKENLDGNEETKAPCEKNIYLLYECLIELKENDYIRKNVSDESLIKILIYNVEKNPSITHEELIENTKDIVENTKANTEIKKDNTTFGEDDDGAGGTKGITREGPWDSTKH